MQSKISSINVAENNTLMGIDLVQTASDSLSIIGHQLERIRELSVQAQNGTYGDQSIAALNQEAMAAAKEITRTIENCEYNGISILKGTEVIKEDIPWVEPPEDLPKAGATGFINDVECFMPEPEPEPEPVHFMQSITQRDTSGMTRLADVSEKDAIKDGTYSITTAAEMKKLADMCENGLVGDNAEFVLGANISLAEYANDNDGTGWKGKCRFSATFDGNGYKITDLTVNDTKGEGALFYEICGGTVKNLGLENFNISSDQGALLALYSDGTIQNCYASNGTINYTNAIAGDSIFVNKNVGSLENINFEGTILADNATSVSEAGRLRSGEIYTISSARDLDCLGSCSIDNGAIIILTEDINYGGEHFIGVHDNFAGHFYGNNHTISNIGESSCSLFNSVNGGTIANLNINNCEFADGACIANTISNNSLISNVNVNDVDFYGTVAGTAPIAGYAQDSTIFNCSSSGTITFVNNPATAGIVGRASNSTVSYCSSSAEINLERVNEYQGTIIGYKDNETIEENNTFTGKITGALTVSDIYGNYNNAPGLVINVSNAADLEYLAEMANNNELQYCGNGTWTFALTNDINIAYSGYDISHFIMENFSGHFEGNGYGILRHDKDIANEIFANPTGTVNNLKGYEASEYTMLFSVRDDEYIHDVTLGISSRYEIAKLAYMQRVGLIGNNCTFILTKDIDCNGNYFDCPIGTTNNPFQGTFDGNGHVIKNCILNNDYELCKGLFGVVQGGTIQNLGIENAVIECNNSTFIGVLAGKVAGNSTIQNCYTTGRINVNSCDNVGGLIGECNGENNFIDNCYSNVSIYGNSNGIVGGLIGQVYRGRVENCYTANCSINGGVVGGLVGNFDSGRIANCFSTANVAGDSYVGGLVGRNAVNIYNSYFAGTVSGNSIVGAIAGANGGSYINAWWDDSKTGKLKAFGKNNAELTVRPYSFNNPNEPEYSSFISLQVGTNGNASSQIGLNTALNLGNIENVIAQGVNSSSIIAKIDTMLSKVNSLQTELGSTQNRLMSVLEAISISYDNLLSSLSTIRDADVAKESSKYIKSQILQQASATLLSTANQTPALTLQLLQGLR